VAGPNGIPWSGDTLMPRLMIRYLTRYRTTPEKQDNGCVHRSTSCALRGMLDDTDFRELVTRLSTALAMTEAAYLEARRRREM
jgi:hypothetical protein